MTTEPRVTHIFLVFLGSKGGGEQLFLDSLREFASKNVQISVVISKEIASLITDLPIKKYIFSVPHRASQLGRIFVNLKNIYLLSRTFRSFEKSQAIIIQIMPSPLDYLIDLLAKNSGVLIYRSIHDLTPHPGEKWPTKKAIKKRIYNADSLIVFSEFIQTSLKSKYGINSQVCSLPSNFYTLRNISETENFFSSTYPTIKVGFVGRALKYKGLDVLADSLNLLKSTNGYNFEFVAAGQGVYPVELQENSKIINRWLTNNELLDFIKCCDLVVFPYIEASQSGLIPIVMSLNKFIVATEVGGLKSQLAGYSKAVICPPNSSKDLARAIWKIFELILGSNHEIDFVSSDNSVIKKQSICEYITNKTFLAH